MITETPGRFTTVDGKVFPYAPSDRGSRRTAYKAAQLHDGGVIAQREQLAGRRLTDRELREGIASPTTEPLCRRFRIRATSTTNENPGDKSGWAAARLAELRANPGRTAEERAAAKRRIQALEAIVKQQEADAEAQAAAQAAAETIAANPKAQAAIAHARSVVSGLFWDSTVPASELEQAGKRLAIAETGDYVGYWTAAKPWVDARDAKILAAAEHERQKAATLADRAHKLSRPVRFRLTLRRK